MTFLSCIFALLLMINAHAEEKDKVVVVMAFEAGTGSASSGKSKDVSGEKEIGYIDAGAAYVGKGLEAKALLFMAKDDVITPGYFTAGYKMTMGNRDYFIGPLKLKGQLGFSGQGDKDSEGNFRFFGGPNIAGLGALCSSNKEEAKVRVCIETFLKGIYYIDTGARVDTGYGLQIEGKVGDTKINGGARHSFMLVSEGFHDKAFTSGQQVTLNLGFEFDVTGKASKNNKK